MNSNGNITIRAPKEKRYVFDELEKLAKEDKRTINSYVFILLEAHVKKIKKK